MDDKNQELASKLGAFFPAEDVGWKPGVVRGGRALAFAYIDARAVMERLDKTVGPTGWRDEYFVLGEGHVECRLSIRVGDEWVTKTDVGSPAGSDANDRLKGAYSDALKRAAVKWGVGRYLYEMPAQWHDFDEQKKQFRSRPTLPPHFTPKVETMGANRGKEIFDLVVADGTDPAKVLSHYRVADFNLIPADKYEALKERFAKKG